MKKPFYPFIRVLRFNSTGTRCADAIGASASSRSITACFTLVALSVLSACVLAAGCASTENSRQETAQASVPKTSTEKLGHKDYERRLSNAEIMRKRWLRHLDNASSTDEIIRCKEELDKIETEIEELKAGADAELAPEDQGFKSVKERHYTYGPLGAIFKLTQWILEKLYLIDKS